jgi:hypothetical protein
MKVGTQDPSFETQDPTLVTQSDESDEPIPFDHSTRGRSEKIAATCRKEARAQSKVRCLAIRHNTVPKYAILPADSNSPPSKGDIADEAHTFGSGAASKVRSPELVKNLKRQFGSDLDEDSGSRTNKSNKITEYFGTVELSDAIKSESGSPKDYDGDKGDDGDEDDDDKTTERSVSSAEIQDGGNY